MFKYFSPWVSVIFLTIVSNALYIFIYYGYVTCQITYLKYFLSACGLFSFFLQYVFCGAKVHNLNKV
jgi:hypothetical protein